MFCEIESNFKSVQFFLYTLYISYINALPGFLSLLVDRNSGYIHVFKLIEKILNMDVPASFAGHVIC